MSRTYAVDLIERIKLLLGEFQTAGDDTEFSYSWNHGYERMDIHNYGEGSLHYAGWFHPGDGVCDTGTDSLQGICIHCGRTLM